MSGEIAPAPDAVVPAPPSPIRRITLDPRLRRLTVRGVSDLSASMRRVTLGGPDLAGFACFGPTDHAKVYFPAAPGGDPALPSVVDGRPEDTGDDRFVFRDYSVRTFDPASGVVTLDMAVHPHGPAGRWAAQASPGQTLGLYGPKTSKLPPLDREWYVLAADEAGIAGLTNWLDRLPQGPRVQAFVEVGGAQDEVALPVRDGVTVTWLHRGPAEAGTTTLLADAVRAASFGAPGGGPGWVWAGAEAMAVRAIRRHVVNDRGLDRTSFAMTGYWRHGVANFDHKSAEAQS